jgi:hypothetical protein
MANNLNVSSVISPDILKTISTAAAITTLGNQLVDQAKEKVISTTLGKAQQLANQIAEVVILEQKVELDHGLELKRLDILLKEKQITKEQYDKAVEVENASYNKKLKDLEKLRLKLQEDRKNIINDPFRKIKEKANARKVRRAKRKSRNKAEKTKARRDLTKKVVSNAAKTLAPIIALQLANQFASIISQRSKLETLVDQVNAYIDQANTPDTVAIASNLRSNTITLINNTISKLTNLQKTLGLISISITIFNTLIPLLNRTAPLTVIGVPPGVPVVTMVAHDEIRNKKQRLEKLVPALSAVLAIATVALANEIAKLNELILRLKNVNLDGLDQQQLSDLTSSIYNNVDDFPPYKGFTFKIKEEQNPAFVVKGNKRRYAVAVDRSGVEVIKSENSFTLDPNDLVEQLKLTIDQRNLQG